MSKLTDAAEALRKASVEAALKRATYQAAEDAASVARINMFNADDALDKAQQIYEEEKQTEVHGMEQGLADQNSDIETLRRQLESLGVVPKV